RFHVPCGDAPPNVCVRVHAEGFAELARDAIGPGEELTLELAWLTELSGTIRDADTGAAVPGATVAVGEVSARSDSDGRYRLTRVSVGSDLTFTAGHPAYLHDEESLFLRTREPRTHDVELARGSPLVLEFYDRESGDPVAGVHVFRRPELESDASG